MEFVWMDRWGLEYLNGLGNYENIKYQNMDVKGH